MKKSIAKLLFVIMLVSQPISVWAALPPGFETETLVTGLNLPTTIAFTPDGRIFIAEKDGTIKVYKNGALLPTPLVKLTDVNSYGDRGLLGIAVDPNFASNGYVYALYSYENTPGTNFGGPKTGRIVRLTVTGDTADESSKVVLVGSVGGELATPSCENYPVTADCIASDTSSHSVGGLRFGPDGKLYASLGDGSHFDYVDPRALRAQNIDALAGKILRINTDGTAPSDNPFFNGSTTANRSKVFSYGTRNDFRFSFRPSNGSLYGGDVGWSSWEEVNKIVAGGNYGWPCREGMGATVGYGCTASSPIDPIYTYPHDGNGAGSITGGAFPTAYPTQYNNSYFFGDYAQNWIKRLVVDANDNFVSVENFMGVADGTNGPVEMITGPDGNIYYLGIYTGELTRILYTTGNRQPIAVIGATPTNGLIPLSVDFTSTGSSDPDLNPISFTWNFGDGSATSSLANPNHVYNANGTYLATLKVTDGQGGQNIKSITISVGNQAPNAQIVAPSTGALYRVGDVVQLLGAATDPEQGTLSDAALSWTLILHHNIHTHPLQILTGANPSFIYPDHQDTDVYVEAKLTATDAGGLTNSKSINLYLNNNPVQSGNLILNPSLESSTAGSPNNWLHGGYGVNDATYIYPVVGFEGVNAAKVQMTTYTSGDAKWSHEPVAVDANKQYAFSGYYQSNVGLGTIVQVGYGNGTYTYMDLGDMPSSTGWSRIDRTFTTPVGAQSVVVMQTLNEPGFLSIDNYSLALVATTSDTSLPIVSFVSPLATQTVSGTTTLVADATDNVGVTSVEFRVDGSVLGTKTTAPFTLPWNTKNTTNAAHNIVAVARDAAGNVATSSTVSVNVLNATGGGTGGTNLVLNPSVETLGAATGTPQSWLKGKFGTNGATFIYPAAAFDGLRGLKLSMPTYTSGDAKWYMQEVPVTPGTAYKFSHYYQADVPTVLQLRYTNTANALSYQTLSANLPATTTWAKTNYNFTPPANIKSVTVFHILKQVGNLSTDLYNINTGTGVSDTVAPIVAISTPQTGTTSSNTIMLRAQAADATSGVSGVKFLVDGIQKGNELITSPYELALDTTTLANGVHVVTAVARDASGNTATSTQVNVTVSNLVNPPPDTTPPTINWVTPLSGATTTGSVSLTVSAVDNTAVVGVDYKVDSTVLGTSSVSPFSFTWNSASTSNGAHVLTATARDAAGNATAQTRSVIVNNGSGTTTDTTPPTINWVTPPSGATTTGLITLSVTATDTVGVVGVDYKVDSTVLGTSSVSPFSFTWNSASTSNGAHILTATARDLAGNSASQTRAVTVSNTSSTTTGPNLIVNGNMETANGANPQAWNRGGWGANTRTFTYPIVGRDGAKGAGLVVSGYTDGDAKWYPNKFPVTPGTQYSFTGWYKSSTIMDVIGEYTMSNGSLLYVGVQKENQPTTTWAKLDTTFSPPVGATQMTLYPLISSNGSVDIDDFSVNALGSTTPNNDTRAPIVAMTAPVNGATVSGTINITASSTDNVAVTKLWFAVDGNVVSPVYATAPYLFALNTTTLTNGSHILKATAEDAVGNNSTGTSTIIVNNGGGGGTITPSVDASTPVSALVVGNSMPKIASYKFISANDSFTITELTAAVATLSDAAAITELVFKDGATEIGRQALSGTTTTKTGLSVVVQTNSSKVIDVYADLGTIGTGFANPGVNVGVTLKGFKAQSSGGVLGSYATNLAGNNFYAYKTKPTITPVALPTTVLAPGTTTIAKFAVTADAGGTLAWRKIVLNIATSGASLSNYSIYDDADQLTSLAGVIVSLNDIGTQLSFNSQIDQDISGTKVYVVKATVGSSLFDVASVTTSINQSGVGYNVPAPLITQTNTAAKFVWSDKSIAGHSNSTSDWVNDFLVKNLPTSPQSLTRVSGGGDPFPPIVAITAPANGATVSSAVTITASSSDNVGVSGVKFLADGVQIGTEDTTSPFSVVWNSASTTNGAHILSAVARDAAGNRATSTVGITVNNSVATTSNLIVNPSVETGTTLPTGWSKGGWGTNNAVLTYPVPGQDGAKGVQVDITSYTDGDAKWYFNPVAITPGESYVYSDYYKSNVSSSITARYTLVGGGFSYVLLGTAPAQANWTKISKSFVAPASSTAVTFFHALEGVGTLSLDNFSLAPGTSSTLFDQGMVSLTFDDGWPSHYTNVLPILNTAGLKGTFGVISLVTLESTPPNMVVNPSIETANGINPANWSRGSYGTNDAVFTYPIAGQNGAKAAKIQITNYTDGDAKWYPDDISVIDTGAYDISDYYMSDATTTVTARFVSGTTTTYQLVSTLSPSATWKPFAMQIVVPANVTSMTIFHALSRVGSLSVDNFNISRTIPVSYLNTTQVLTLQAYGMEIASHTRTHASLSTIATSTMQTEILGSRNELLGMGATPVTSLIYPYGDYNDAVEAYAQSVGYLGARSVDRGYNDKTSDKFALKIQQVDINTTVDQIKTWIDTATANKTWLILMFHQVDTAGAELSMTPANFQQVVDYLKTQSTPVVTMQQGLSQM